MREQLLESHFAVGGIHLRDEIGKDLLDRRIPGKLPVLDKRRKHCRGHGLRVRTEMKFVVDCDRSISAIFADSNSADSDQALAGDDGSSERG